jgi:hypothetical protein
VVPDDHLVREIAGVLDLSWVHAELAPYYSPLGRPSIDPVLMIRMLIVGYVFAIRSERLLCREVKVNLAYLSLSETYALKYWWCSPPKTGIASVRPTVWTARGIGASLCSDRCVRASL